MPIISRQEVERLLEKLEQELQTNVRRTNARPDLDARQAEKFAANGPAIVFAQAHLRSGDVHAPQR